MHRLIQLKRPCMMKLALVTLLVPSVVEVIEAFVLNANRASCWSLEPPIRKDFTRYAPQRGRHGTQSRNSAAAASNGNADDSLDQMRRMLEASWDAPSMGVVPTDPDAAAIAAASSLLSAMDQEEQLGAVRGIYFIHLLLPQYDSASGPKIYDEVVATEFCVALAEQLKERQTQIVLRDARTLSNVRRVLEAREQYFDGGDDAEESNPRISSSKSLQEADEDEDEEDDAEDLLEGDADAVQDFRAKLMSSWETSPTSDGSSGAKEETNPDEPPQAPPPQTTAQTKPKQYRLASLLGATTSFRNGPKMMNQVLQAVSVNARARADEDTVILLNPSSSPAEVIGIRALAAKYKSLGKAMVLVNSQLDPLPRELAGGVTAYSIQPLIGKLKDSALDGATSAAEPRVVVLRRYPRDWELYVDDGSEDSTGFVLAATVPPKALPNPVAGPTIEWVVRQLEDYLQAKSSSSSGQSD